MKQITALAFVLILMFFFCGCSSNGKTGNGTEQNPADTTHETTEMMIVPIDWSDFIKLGGVIYVGDWRETEVSPDKIGEKIGEVLCGVPTVYTDGKGNVSDDTPAEGASFLCNTGTELFSVRDTENSIAALVDGRYYLYSAD